MDLFSLKYYRILISFTLFLIATNITKIKIILFLNWKRKEFEPILKELWYFLSKKLSSQSFQKYPPDPGSGKTYSLSRIRIRNTASNDLFWKLCITDLVEFTHSRPLQ
jgi:hypothetical protein